MDCSHSVMQSHHGLGNTGSDLQYRPVSSRPKRDRERRPREGVIIDSGQMSTSIDARCVIITFLINAFEEDDDSNDPEKRH